MLTTEIFHKPWVVTSRRAIRELRDHISEMWAFLEAKKEYLNREDILRTSIITRRLGRALMVMEDQIHDDGIWEGPVDVQGVAALRSELRRLHRALEGDRANTGSGVGHG